MRLATCSLVLAATWGALPSIGAFLTSPPFRGVSRWEAPAVRSWRVVTSSARQPRRARGDSEVDTPVESMTTEVEEPRLLEDEEDRDGSPVAEGPGSSFDRESRQLVGLLAGLGTLETAFLTYEKLFSSDGLSSLCSVGGLSLRCGDVLNSEYANVLGVPLTLPAVLAYGSVCVLALGPLLAPEGGSREAADLKTRDPILLLTTSMATFSAYLMWLLATKLGVACPFCLASAALSFSMAAVTWSKRTVPDATRANVYKIGSVLTTGLLSGLVYLITSTQALVASQSYAPPGVTGERATGPYAPPAITRHSDERAMRVADRLQAMNSRMYGAFWCSHCYEQKQTLGLEAYAQGVKYIECAKDGLNSQTALCKEKKVPGYPTWEIDGAFYPGEKTIEQLEELTGLREPSEPVEQDLSPLQP